MKNTGLNLGQKVPAPTRYEVLQSSKKIWCGFPIEIVQNSFKGCGQVFEDGIDYSMGTESDSEVEAEHLEQKLKYLNKMNCCLFEKRVMKSAKEMVSNYWLREMEI